MVGKQCSVVTVTASAALSAHAGHVFKSIWFHHSFFQLFDLLLAVSRESFLIVIVSSRSTFV